MSQDFLFQGLSVDLDPELSELISREDRRQRESLRKRLPYGSFVSKGISLEAGNGR